MAETLSAAEMSATRIDWIGQLHTLATNLQSEIQLHPAFADTDAQKVLEAEGVHLLKWVGMLEDVLELAWTYFTQPTTDEKQSYIELWLLVHAVYSAMSSHMANPNFTEGRRSICEHSAIGPAYEEFKEHRFAYWNQPWGMDFDVALEHERETE